MIEHPEAGKIKIVFDILVNDWNRLSGQYDPDPWTDTELMQLSTEIVEALR